MKTDTYPPRQARVASNEPCRIARADGSTIQGSILNISYSGFCVGANCRFIEGERIEMRILGLGRFKGTVRWARRGRAGGRLDV